MVRRTRLKVDSLDLPNIFADGYVKRSGLVVTGNNWLYEKYIVHPPQTDQTIFQLTRPIPLNEQGQLSISFLKMFVNGVSIDLNLLSVDSNANNTLIYDSQNSFPIDSSDLVEFWIAETNS